MKLSSVLSKRVGEVLLMLVFAVSVASVFTVAIEAAERELGAPEWASTVLATALLLGLVPFQKSRWMVALCLVVCAAGVGHTVWDRSLVPPPSERTVMSCVRVVEGRHTGIVCRDEKSAEGGRTP